MWHKGTLLTGIPPVIHKILLPLSFGFSLMKSHSEGTVIREREDILQNVISKLLVIPKEDIF